MLSTKKYNFRIKPEVLNDLDPFSLSQWLCVNHLSPLCLGSPLCSTGMCHSGMCTYLLHEDILSQVTTEFFVEHSEAQNFFPGNQRQLLWEIKETRGFTLMDFSPPTVKDYKNLWPNRIKLFIFLMAV